jgi:predicted glycosyltransferase
LIGNHKGKSRIRKVFGLAGRISQLAFRVPKFDISLSIGGQNTTPVSYLRNKPSIVFSDNDTSYKYHSYKLGSYFIFPAFFSTDNLIKKLGISTSRIFTYNGFKEDIYIADYAPNPDSLSELPFKNFITIRPENLKASYVPPDSKSIVPELFERLTNENILYLPRYSFERKYADGYKNIYIPKAPLPGLDVCYYTKAMMTGAGSFAREAAILGTPSVSFFPGKNHLSVDKKMQENKWVYWSRSPIAISEYIKKTKKRKNPIHSSKEVQDELFAIIGNIFSISKPKKRV